MVGMIWTCRTEVKCDPKRELWGTVGKSVGEYKNILIFY